MAAADRNDKPDVGRAAQQLLSQLQGLRREDLTADDRAEVSALLERLQALLATPEEPSSTSNTGRGGIGCQPDQGQPALARVAVFPWAAYGIVHANGHTCCKRPAVPRGLSEKSITVLAEAYELSRQSVIVDEQMVETWDQPTDDLVVWLSQKHHWRAEMTVSYLATMKRLQAA